MTMDTKYLEDWDINEQSKRALFMQHMYKCSGRTNGLYTGLWQEFCLKEAGPYCRDMWFDQQRAIKEFIEQTNLRQLETLHVHDENCEPDCPEYCAEPFIPTFSD